MSALFNLPHTVSLPGAKLTFTQTGTTTPQNTYTDEALSVASSNPVVADSNGVFEAIYLDPSLPSYRVKLTTSADVLIYQQDGVPSTQNQFKSARIQSDDPFIFFEDTNGSSGFRKYRIRVAGNTIVLEGVSDNEAFTTTLLSASAFLLSLQVGSKIGSNNISTEEHGTYTATLTGCTTSPTGTVRYNRVGTMVVLHIPAISGTSNATTMTLTGTPAALAVGADTTAHAVFVTDNGTASIGTVSIDAATRTLTFGLGASSAAFTNSGTKGVRSSIMVYGQS